MSFFIRELHRDDENKLLWWGSRRHQEYIHEWILRSEKGELIFLGLFNGDDIIGACHIDFVMVTGVGTLVALHVRDEFRSQGLGTMMMEAAEEIVHQRGLPAIELRVEITNDRARQLYERRGYVVIGESDESWEQDDERGNIELYRAKAYVMRKELADV